MNSINDQCKGFLLEVTLFGFSGPQIAAFWHTFSKRYFPTVRLPLARPCVLLRDEQTWTQCVFYYIGMSQCRKGRVAPSFDVITEGLVCSCICTLHPPTRPLAIGHMTCWPTSQCFQKTGSQPYLAWTNLQENVFFYSPCRCVQVVGVARLWMQVFDNTIGYKFDFIFKIELYWGKNMKRNRRTNEMRTWRTVNSCGGWRGMLSDLRRIYGT